MDQVTALRLTAALTLAAGRPGPCLALLGAVQEHVDAATRQLVRAWALGADTAAEEAETREDVRVLAGRLATASRTDAVLARQLDAWLSDTFAAPDGPRPAPSAQVPHAAPSSQNAFDAEQVDGVVVQARAISGGLHIHPATAAGPTRPVPRQIPPPPAYFTSRERERAALERLARAPRDAPAVAVISGPAGVGKSALAQSVLGATADVFPDGLLFADLQGRSPAGPARPSGILGEFLRALGHSQVPLELAELTALWRSVTAEVRIAVFLDDALSAAQARPLLPASPAALTLVTSRGRLTGLGLDGADFHPLDVLDATDALELLSRRIGESRVHREPDAARRVALACGGLPLAVCVAAARMAARPRQPLAALAAELGESGQDALDALRLEGESAVRAALDASYRLLPPDLARAYRRLGLAPVAVLDAPVAAAVCEVTEARAGQLLDELAEVSLLQDLGPATDTGPVRYRYHDLVRAHAHDLAHRHDPPEEREAAWARTADYYLATTTAAETLLTPSHRTLPRDYTGPVRQQPPFTDDKGALSWLDAERTRLMAVLRSAAEHGADRLAWQLADAMWPLFLRLRPYDLWIEAHEIGLAAARRAGDRDGLRRMLTSGGGGLYNAGRYSEAYQWYDDALEAAREDAAASAGDEQAVARHRRDEAQALHGLGRTCRATGRLAEAAAYFRAALELREALGYHRGAALSRLWLGDVALAAGRPEEAIDHLGRARDELLAVQDSYDAARALAFLGSAHAGAGHHAEADRQLAAALAEFEDAGSMYWQAHVLEMLGETAERRGDRQRARERYEESRARYAPVSDSDARRVESRSRRLDETR